MSRRTKEQIISERISILKQTSIFSGSEESVLTEIALKLSEKKIEKGKVVFKKGSIGKSMYIIAKGMVRIHDGGHVYARMETANVFGEYALIDEETRSASVTADKDSLLYKLEQDDFYALLAQKPEITKSILRVLIQRIRNMNVLEEKLAKNFLKVQSQKKEIESQHTNLSEKKELLEIQNYDLLTLNEEKNHQISILIHGMKNPLTSSLCMTDLLLSNSDNLTDTQKNYVELIHNSSGRIDKLIDEILNIDVIESKTLRLKYERINLRKAILDVTNSLKFRAQTKKIEFKLDLAFIDAKLNLVYLIQILENLLSNAIKFSEKGKSIDIRLYSENKKAIIEVEDQGPGIKAEILKDIFDLYERQTDINNTEPLTGLGLAIVKRYANTMNGDVKCNSELGKGSKFTVIFDKFIDQE